MLNECCWLYNHFLEQRKTLWEENQTPISMYDQHATIPELKQDRGTLKNAYSQVLQNVGTRIDLAFKAFFRRCKNGEKPGYPRFKSKFRYDSFTYPQLGFSVEPDKGYVKLSKIGKVKTVFHRPIEGKIKTCTVKRSATGKWYATFSCLVEPKPLPPNDQRIGIDVGIASFATFSDGSTIENPRFFKQEERALAKANRAFEPFRGKKWSKAKAKRQQVLARVYERISNKRKDFAHQTARRLINDFGVIAVEDLNINKMKETNPRSLNKNISDAAWRMFTELLSFKAEEAGRKVVKVNPAYTSQDCSSCGYRVVKRLADRVHRCPNCDLVLARDHNAAINILALGLQCLT